LRTRLGDGGELIAVVARVIDGRTCRLKLQPETL
jgi:hypothetical protein